VHLLVLIIGEYLILFRYLNRTQKIWFLSICDIDFNIVIKETLQLGLQSTGYTDARFTYLEVLCDSVWEQIIANTLTMPNCVVTSHKT
jgi:hypothetical protein